MIVPVYNAVAYIEQCVQSLIGQTYQNWAALLIDDGSTDHSLLIKGIFNPYSKCTARENRELCRQMREMKFIRRH